MSNPLENSKDKVYGLWVSQRRTVETSGQRRNFVAAKNTNPNKADACGARACSSRS